MSKINDVVKVSDRGIITIPLKYRQALNVEDGGFVGVKITKAGVILSSLEIKEKALKKKKTKSN